MPGIRRSPAVRARALQLLDDGWSLRAIGRELEVHHTTVSWWRDGGGAGAVTRAPAMEVGWETANSRERDAWAYLLGMYLGDGYIDPLDRLRVYCDESYPGIIGEVDRALRRVGVHRPWHASAPGCRVVMAGPRQWAGVLPSGRGPKHTYVVRLDGWQLEAVRERPHLVLRGLIHADGCRFVNVVRGANGREYRYPTYDFVNLSTDVMGVFEACCTALGVSYRPASSGRSRRVARRCDVERLDLVVGAKR